MTSASKSVLICVFYGATSVSLSMINKAVLSKFEFRCFFFLIALQLCFTMIACLFVKSLHPSKRPCEIPSFDWGVYRKSIPMALTFVLNVGAGFVALHLVNIPVFLCIRRTATAFVMLAEFLVLRRVASTKVQFATGLIACGAVVAGYPTLAANYVGYIFVILNNIMTALNLTLARRFSDETAITAFGLMFYNSLTALPVAIVFGLVTGEVSTLMEYEYLYYPTFHVAVFVSCTVGVLLAYSLILCSTVNSPLATSVTGNLKDLGGTTLGVVLFHDFVPTIGSVTGLTISFTGAIWFSTLRLAENRRKAQEEAEEAGHGADEEAGVAADKPGRPRSSSTSAEAVGRTVGAYVTSPGIVSPLTTPLTSPLHRHRTSSSGKLMPPLKL